jgi:hypothetical protein
MNGDLARASKTAGIPRVTPNDLRRTFASWLIEAGVTREEVAKMLGHSGTAMVFRVYGRADPEKEGESIRRRLAAIPPTMAPAVVPGLPTDVRDALYVVAKAQRESIARLFEREHPWIGRGETPYAEKAALICRTAELVYADPDGTDPSQSPLCSGMPAAVSSCFSGVSDGDRTRDNRSHNPVAGRKRPAKP